MIGQRHNQRTTGQNHGADQANRKEVNGGQGLDPPSPSVVVLRAPCKDDGVSSGEESVLWWGTTGTGACGLVIGDLVEGLLKGVLACG